MSEINNLFNQFDQIVDERRYRNHSFVTELVAGNVSKEQLKKWAIQKYFQVFQQNRAFSAIHSNSPYPDARKYLMEQLIAEETDIECGSDSHYDLIKRLVYAAGGTDEEIENTSIGDPVKDYLNFVINTCKNEHFTYGLLTFYSLESQTPDSVIKMYEALKNQFGFSDHDLEWFTIHYEADQEHGEKGRELIEKYWQEAPNFKEKSFEIVNGATEMWTKLHDYYYSVVKG
ncbi:MAG TPA: hypothetical protein GXX18_18885 [Bacillales bacterium]|nr:hypothetical protein [Bacillales bacterium]